MIFDLFKREKQASDMWLFVGLGNPGDKYASHRHNIGFMVIDELARAQIFPPFRSKFQGELSEGKIAGEKAILLKPQTYMNDSGVSVSKCAKFYKIPPERIIVFHDELDLPFGKLKVKQGGGAGGHNGLKSIDKHLGDKNYWRVRMGIDHPGDKNRVSGYVLSDFTKAEKQALPRWLDVIAQNIDYLAQDNQTDFMTRVAEDNK
ncbi:MAG: aminoacyl-tRNA hydrolase [Alphaproteobacteria bacterium]|nr:aminoacyl-tRNA hydrolase [Alphaproteobacteria bacterium]